jgi:hypothetical protein
MFKTRRLNGDARLLTATVPAIIREPELAFDAEKWRHPKAYGMISHRHPPNTAFIRCHDKSGFVSFPPKVNVGTDIVHAVVLTGVTGFLHFRLGNVDPTFVLTLLVGSIPGGLLGSHLATCVPLLWLRRILCALLLMTGARMLRPL